MKSTTFTYLLTAVMAMTLTSCELREIQRDKPVVSVGDKVLTTSQLQAKIPHNIPEKDSVEMAEKYVRSWVSRQVLLHQAEKNLADEEIDIQEEIDAYRNSLIIERYERKLTAQKFQPNVTDEDIERYYNEMGGNFRLNEDIIKCLFAILPVNTPDLKEFRKKITKMDEEEFAEIEQYLYRTAIKYSSDVDRWQPLSTIKVFFPENTIKNEVVVFSTHRLYEVSDEENVYFLLVFDWRKADDIAPIEFVSDKIYTILLNKEKMDFMKETKRELYESALRLNIVKYYNEK